MNRSSSALLAVSALALAAGMGNDFYLIRADEPKVNPFDDCWQPGDCRHFSVSVGTPGRRCGWRKRNDQKKSDRKKKRREQETRHSRAYKKRLRYR